MRSANTAPCATQWHLSRLCSVVFSRGRRPGATNKARTKPKRITYPDLFLFRSSLSPPRARRIALARAGGYGATCGRAGWAAFGGLRRGSGRMAGDFGLCGGSAVLHGRPAGTHACLSPARGSVMGAVFTPSAPRRAYLSGGRTRHPDTVIEPHLERGFNRAQTPRNPAFEPSEPQLNPSATGRRIPPMSDANRVVVSHKALRQKMPQAARDTIVPRPCLALRLGGQWVVEVAWSAPALPGPAQRMTQTAT